MKSSTQPCVFLCHASEDKPSVRRLCSKLRNDGFAPWLDEDELLPGQDWQTEIRRTLPSADVVIVCLSSKSVQKIGFVQTEIKIALDAADQRPEGAIFLIPAKLEPCDIPWRLREWQAVNLYDANGYHALKRSLASVALSIRLWHETPDDEFAPSKDPETLRSVMEQFEEKETNPPVPGFEDVLNQFSSAVRRFSADCSTDNLELVCILSRAACAYFFDIVGWSDACEPRFEHQLLGAFDAIVRAFDQRAASAFHREYVDSINARVKRLKEFIEEHDLDERPPPS